MAAAEAAQGPRQGLQPGAPAIWERNGVQVDGVTVEPPSALSPSRDDVEMLTEEEKASLCLLGLRCGSLSTITPIKVRVAETKYQLDSYLKDVRGLLSTGLLEGFKVTYKKDEVRNACEFEQHSGQSSNNQNDHIFLETGVSLFKVVKALKHYKLYMLGDFIQPAIGMPPNMAEYKKWKALSESQEKGISGPSTGTSKKNGTEDIHTKNTAGPISINGVKPDSLEPTAIIAEYSKHDPANLVHSLASPVTIAQEPLPNCNTGPKSKESKTRDTTLHPLLFKEGGLPDNTLLIYKLKNGEALKQGYRNIYTSEGVTLHKLALQLQDCLNPNGFGNANISSFSDYPNITSGNVMVVIYAAVHYNSSFSCGKEPSTTSVLVPLKRTLQERVVETERDGHTTIGNIDPDTIVFCNQVPLEILKEYVRFCFLCCEKCRVLRTHLDEELEKCEEIAFLRRIRYHICWRLLSGMDISSDVQLYMRQVIDILRDAFAETAEHSGFFSDMVYAKDVEGEKDFRGMYCAVLTASKHVVSAAILKGYFVLLLNSIEAHLRAWNVNLLVAPVDPEMAPIWSEKLGFTILSDEEKKSMLEVHPLVMFENLLLVQKSLA
ncbi:hypothetical protein HU200_025023 [Digitaria exilis]|uniref:Increased DNA methylation 1 C-terminal domain-containing protein n=1 Tax=Digitaria exilis TaxID=1010633 RepID=A0A835C0D0_9POAL|nr:hypothetical protein HU200_025023 [Digitaria exilis]